MRESLRLGRLETGFAALAALLVFGGDAAAQDTRTYVERNGYREFQDFGGNTLLRTPTANTSFSVDTDALVLTVGEMASLPERPRADASGDEDVIVVTGQREDLVTPPDPAFQRSFLPDSVTTIQNPENDGLYMPLRNSQIEGWQGARIGLDLPFGLELPESVSLSLEGKRDPGFRVAVRS